MACLTDGEVGEARAFVVQFSSREFVLVHLHDFGVAVQSKSWHAYRYDSLKVVGLHKQDNMSIIEKGEQNVVEEKQDLLEVEDPMKRSLKRFYESPQRLAELTAALRGPSRVSLRVLDWLVTNYAKRVNVVYTSPVTGSAFNMYMAYRSQLKGYRKAEFDPFCRRQRIMWVDSKGQEFETTIGQLTFFRWALTTGVIDYCRQHAKQIESDMLKVQAKRQDEQTRGVAKKTRRKELSRAAVKGCTSTNIKVTLSFS